MSLTAYKNIILHSCLELKWNLFGISIHYILLVSLFLLVSKIKTAIHLTTFSPHFFDYTNIIKAFNCPVQGCEFFSLRSHGLVIHISVAQKRKQKIGRSVSIDLETHQSGRLSLPQIVAERGKRTKINRVIFCSPFPDSSPENRPESSIIIDSTRSGSPTRSFEVSNVHSSSENGMILQLCVMFLDLKEKASTKISDIAL